MNTRAKDLAVQMQPLIKDLVAGLLLRLNIDGTVPGVPKDVYDLRDAIQDSVSNRLIIHKTLPRGDSEERLLVELSLVISMIELDDTESADALVAECQMFAHEYGQLP
jgi:hypothetical protein